MALWISLISTGVSLVCALIVLAAVRKSSEQQLQVRDLCARLSNERGRIAAHDAELDQITETLRKLSGRIGAVRKEAKQTAGSLDDPADVSNVNRLTWKAQMREKYGLVPSARS